ncbi:protein of unknown function [Paramicrobacterium humi]|uniref:DUF4350 domain-containing protein n=1 Tax=Paramicrobacterium humi TaxID=640635 RepID=A0A1H4P3S0_9MICO|nr:DUF4350 domain-containing protein [Microbacterium humi]SEC01828.1 protein of unknown function [Microbacterium humi]
MTATPATTPTVRTGLRRSAFWIVCGIGALLIAVLVIALSGGGSRTTQRLQADSAAPTGAQALVNVLGDHGVRVTAVDNRADAARALAGSDATLLVYDASGFLDPEALADLRASAARTVLVEPGFLDLRTIAPGVLAGGTEADDAAPVDAKCDVPAAVNAQSSEPFATYRITNAAATGCFPVGDDRFGLVALSGSATTIVGNAGAFTNERILHGGNAALALNLLGGTDTLVWYLPSIADAAGGDELPSLGELTPDWLVPVTTLLALTAIGAMVWRGRRFGPVVVEQLPVTVPARETMEGRARIYARSGARLRALDALRIGTAGRLARMLGMPQAATVWQIADQAASVVGEHPTEVRRVLIDAVPGGDAELMALSGSLADLERRVFTATDETGRMKK